MKRVNNKIVAIILGAVLLTSCHKDLEKLPPNTVTSADVYKSEAGYKQVLAKVYGSMALTGNIGPNGAGDVAGIDEGNSDFTRLFWKMQEITTDEAIIAWDGPLDVGLQDLQLHRWQSSNPLTKGLYYRCVYIITLCNEFIRESSAAKLSDRGISGEAANRIAGMQAEAKFMRAFQYWVLMDLFGNPAFVTEEDGIGTFRPKQILRPALFKYIEEQLIAVETALPNPRSNEYGRVDKAAVWSLLARLYLNAEKVYGVAPKYNEAATNAKKVIDAGYSLLSNYRWLMLADNNVGNNEFIWTLNYDGIRSKNYGATTFLVNASVGGDMDQTFSGLLKWAGIRAKQNLPALFPDVTGVADKRAQFVVGKSANDAPTVFTDGLGSTKFRNRTRTDGFGTDPNREFSDIDFPIFRLAEMYLIYSEAVLRGATTGTAAQSLTYINLLRQRAYQGTSGNITAGSLNLDFILDERGRELYWEGFRRTDLLRFDDKFTKGTYLWPWKGANRNGAALGAHQNLYPIPDSEVAANPNIKQNTGY